jgi:hypothetical protein
VGCIPFFCYTHCLHSVLVVGPNEHRGWIPSYVLAHCTNPLL